MIFWLILHTFKIREWQLAEFNLKVVSSEGGIAINIIYVVYMLYLNVLFIVICIKCIRLCVYLQAMYKNTDFPISKMLIHLPHIKVFLHIT